MAVDFAATLIELRRGASLTQEQMAERCGFSVRTLRNLESGRHRPRRSTVELIVDGLDLDEKDAASLRAAVTTSPREQATPADKPSTPHQLPADSRLFAGRESELRRLDALTAGTSPLVVICGAGGVGKTALAVRWARSTAGRFTDGEVFVDMRGYSHASPVEPAEALGRLLLQIGVRPHGTTVDDLITAWRSAVDGRKILVIFDNVASADQVRPLLPTNPGCCVVVTSRAALAGLVAREGATRLQLDVLPPEESTGLLLSAIASSVRADSADIRRLAKACGHLPLALRIAAELATARPDIGLADLADRLERDPLRELRTPDDPHIALRAVLMSSYAALPKSAAQALRQLGVHPTAAFDRDTASHLLGLPPHATFDQLDLLVRAHMISALGDGTYAMHDLLYAFARELSEQDPAESAAAFARLADHLLSAARHAVADLDGRGQQWLADKRSVLVATAVQAARSGRYQAAVDFADVLGSHLEATAAYDELLVLLTEVTEAAERLGLTARAAEALRLTAVAHYRLGRPEPAIAAAHRALAAFRAIADRRGEARCLMNIGSVRWRSGFGDDALVWYQRALDAYRDIADHLGVAGALCNVGVVLSGRGQNEEARGCYTEALATYQQMGERRFESIALSNLGEIYLRLGQLDEARDMEARAAALARQTGNRTDEGIALGNLGEISLRQNRDAEARRYFVMALKAARDVGDRIGEGLALDNLGTIHHRRGDLSRADRSYRHGQRLAQETQNREGQCSAAIHLAQLAIRQRQWDSARHLASDAVALAMEIDLPTRAAQALDVLAAIDEQIGDDRSALSNRRRALYNARRSSDVSEIAAALNRLASHHAERGKTRLAGRYRRYADAVVPGPVARRG